MKELDGIRLSCQNRQRRSKSFVMLGYQIHFKVALCAPKTRSEDVLIQMIVDD
jgi:hypothetical protein